ncbi:MAG: 3-hydroxyacyl-CoA dehydrogenase family protein [Eubacterium sp.]|nr:3-hydroxyacyl-CoA dehydrogenase family protein [Eubacterium sp.]
MEIVGICGVGTIGAAEILLVTGNGIPVIAVGNSEKGLVRCRKQLDENWDALIRSGCASEQNKRAAMKLLTLSNDSSTLAPCSFIFEAVAEDLSLKKEVYGAIEAVTSDETVIASCTSSIDAADLAACCSRPRQLLIAHPFQPVHLQPLVELVCHDQTADSTRTRAVALLEQLHRQVVVLKKSVPGFLVNRFAQTLFRESLYLIESGVTTAEDIDRAMKYAVGMRYANIGLLEYFDAVGFGLESAIAKNVYPDLCSTTDLQKTVLDGLGSGQTGKTAGKGLYDWSKRDPADYQRRLQEPFYFSVSEWNLPE